MNGKLINENGIWWVIYDFNKKIRLDPLTNPFGFSYNSGDNIAFTTKEIVCSDLAYENIKFNGISEIFAVLIDVDTNENWDEIFKIWRTTKNLDNYEISYNDWLKDNYLPPVKR